MIVLSVSPVAFSLFGISIYWYGIIYAFSLFSSWAIATWILRGVRDHYPKAPSPEQFDKIMFVFIVLILIGARLGHILFFEFEYYFNNPIEILMIRKGGLSFHGSVIALAIYIYSIRKRYGLKFIGDLLCFAGSFGVGIGRIANFINQELYGQITSSENSVIFSFVDKMPRYPTQLYESLFEGFLNFWIMLLLFRIKGAKTIGSGAYIAIFSIIYSSSRFIIEFYKDVETHIYFGKIYMTTGQILSIFLFVFGIFMLYYREISREKNL